jgi:hypothetical protein
LVQRGAELKKEIKMQVAIKTVNANGLKEIHQFLAANPKLGGAHFDQSMLCAWASDAEFSFAEGNYATIELKSWDSVNKRTQTFTVSNKGLDVEFVEIEE